MPWYEMTPTNPNHASFHELKGHGYYTAHLDTVPHEGTGVLDFMAGMHRAASISRYDERDAAGNYVGPRQPRIDKSNRPGDPTWENAHVRIVKPH